jgi:CubicO group peptidase (beta-lactamase class C family)
MWGRKVQRHSGSWAGFRTHIVRVPSEKLAIVILANRSDAGTADLATTITGFYLLP